MRNHPGRSGYSTYPDCGMHRMKQYIQTGKSNNSFIVEEIEMKKNMMRAAALAGVMTLALGMFTACGGNTDDNSATGDTTAAAGDTTAAADASTDAKDYSNLSGKISMSGSTSMQKLAQALAESFTAKYPGVTVTPEFTGSSAGIEAVTAGTVDIGNSSRNLTDSEKSAGVVENIVAIDGIAVVTNKDVTVEDLTKQQLTDIYTGKIDNWSDLKGSDEAIVVIGREAGSGTRGAFEELLEVEDKCKYANELDSTGAVLAKVASTPGAIGYVSLDVVDDTVNAMKLEGVEPTAENIKAGSYFLCRPFVMATKGEISEQSEPVQALFDYLKSDEGKALVEQVGLITVD